MDSAPRHILAKNVRALMKASRKLTTLQKLADASGVSKGVVERMTKAEANTGIDHLEGIAKAFEIPLWLLLSEDLDPLTKTHVNVWPFEELSPYQYAELPDRKKGAIEARVLDLYREWELSQKAKDD